MATVPSTHWYRALTIPQTKIQADNIRVYALEAVLKHSQTGFPPRQFSIDKNRLEIYNGKTH
jgi:hypothetical protein